MTDEEWDDSLAKLQDVARNLKPRPDQTSSCLDSDGRPVMYLGFTFQREDLGYIAEWEKAIAAQLQDHGFVVKKATTPGSFTGPEPDPESDPDALICVHCALLVAPADLDH